MTKISSNLLYSIEREVPCHDVEKVREILNQPFSYLNKGVQTFVFASQDGKYVIKFLRHDHLRPALWAHFLPQQWRESKAAKKRAKLNKDFISYKIAYEELREETGLVFVHLNKTDYLKQKLSLIDKIGVGHCLDLDQFEFLVQKRAELLYPTLENLIDQGKIEDVKVALSNLVHLLAKKFDKGIFDKDPDLNTNFGFVGNEVVQIDIGRFRKEDQKLKREMILRITDHLHQWLMTRSSELDDHLKLCIEHVI